MKGLILVLSGPSGVGKSTVIREMISSGLAGCECLFSVSMTTRAPRRGEIEGVHYLYVTHEEFIDNINKGKLLEHAQYDRDFYGTPLAPIQEIVDSGGCALLDIEVQGMVQARKRYGDIVTVFIKPPSWEELERRLRERGSEDEEKIKKRLIIAHNELNMAGEYQYIIVNDDARTAALDLAAIIRAERLRVERGNN